MRSEERRDRVVPGAVAAPQFGSEVSRRVPLRGARGGVDVDTAVGERDHPEAFAPAPGLGGDQAGQPLAGQYGAPGGLPAVAKAGVMGEVLATQGAVDAVGGDHDVGGEVPGRRTDHRAAAFGAVDALDGGHRDPVPDRAVGERGGQGGRQGRAVYGERGPAVAGRHGGGVGAVQPVAAGAAHAHRRGDGVAGGPGDVEADGIEGAQGVGGARTIPAPRAGGPGARSQTVTRQPRRCRASAAVSPPDARTGYHRMTWIAEHGSSTLHHPSTSVEDDALTLQL
ncbi:hypothetical protein GCM10020254_10150 [Streptomyces goshikiensis]